MRRKIVWCTFWLTVVMWFGRAWADMPVPATAPAAATTTATTKPAATAPSATLAPSTSPATLPATLPTTRRATESARKPAPPHPQEVLTNPNFQGGQVTPTLDRSHWPAVTVGPEPGLTRHRPVYFQDMNFDLRRCPGRGMASPQRDFVAALGNARIDYLGLNNPAHGFVEPVKFCVDLAILAPVKAVIQPPFLTVTSP